MKILFLSHKIPYPPNKGDRIPTFHRIKHLSRKHDISLAFPCFSDEELGKRGRLEKYCSSIDTALIRPFRARLKSLPRLFTATPLTLPCFYSKTLHKKIKARLKKESFDLIYVYSSSMAQYVSDVRGIKKVVDLADSDSHKWLQYAKHLRPPMSIIYYREWLTLKKYERFLAANFDHTISISENEKKLFETYIPDLKMSVVPNGVDLEYFGSGESSVVTNGVVFVGAMDYFANVDAVLYFCREILPLIRRQIPDIKFYIVGSGPVTAVKKLGRDKNIIVTGPVKDVRPYLKKAGVFVAPLRIARGIQNKILEAMASGIPVVTTPCGNEGINAADGRSIFVADTPLKFAQSVTALFNDEKLRKNSTFNAKKFVADSHEWGVNMDRLESVLTEVCA